MQCLLAWIYGRVEKKAAPRWAPHEGKINRKMSTQRFLVGAILYILGVAFSLSNIYANQFKMAAFLRRESSRKMHCRRVPRCLRESGESPKSFVTRTAIRGCWAPSPRGCSLGKLRNRLMWTPDARHFVGSALNGLGLIGS